VPFSFGQKYPLSTIQTNFKQKKEAIFVNFGNNYWNVLLKNKD